MGKAGTSDAKAKFPGRRMASIVRSLSWRKNKRSPRHTVGDHHTVEIYKMPGEPRVGIGLVSEHGHVVVASVLPEGPAAMLVAVNEVVVAVNGTPVGADAAAAQKAIIAGTAQSTATGRMLPVRLTLGKLECNSPKGIDADFRCDISDPARCHEL